MIQFTIPKFISVIVLTMCIGCDSGHEKIIADKDIIKHGAKFTDLNDTDNYISYSFIERDMFKDVIMKVKKSHEIQNNFEPVIFEKFVDYLSEKTQKHDINELSQISIDFDLVEEINNEVLNSLIIINKDKTGKISINDYKDFELRSLILKKLNESYFLDRICESIQENGTVCDKPRFTMNPIAYDQKLLGASWYEINQSENLGLHPSTTINISLRN